MLLFVMDTRQKVYAGLAFISVTFCLFQIYGFVHQQVNIHQLFLRQGVGSELLNYMLENNTEIIVSYFGPITWYHEKVRPNYKHCYRHLPKNKLCKYSNTPGDFKTSDAMIIRGWKLTGKYFDDIKKQHKQRNSNQTWIFFENEPPYKVWAAVNLTKLDYMFNLTASYAPDSDVPRTETKRLRKCIRNTTALKQLEHVDYHTKKRSDVLAAWFVSNCKTQSKREGYVEELKQYMKVDIYGECGDKQCGTKYPLQWYKETCHRDLLHNNNSYMFYFAFENSLCKDYVTEKLWKLERLDVIPVVLGGVDYSEIMPTDSYIDVKNFSSPKALADYLKHVASDPKRYDQYIRNRHSLICKPLYTTMPWDCQLCQKLHEIRGKTKTVDKVSEFWSMDRCIKAEILSILQKYT